MTSSCEYVLQAILEPDLPGLMRVVDEGQRTIPKPCAWLDAPISDEPLSLSHDFSADRRLEVFMSLLYYNQESHR